MNYNDPLERKARACINELKKEYVIDIMTAERLQDIFVYLFLAQANKNQRGIDMQKTALENVLRNCLSINKPHLSNLPQRAAAAVSR